jgi:YHS domain-containing protein
MLKWRHVVRLVTATLLLGFAIIAAPAWAQDLTQADSPRLAIGGYDPVAYFTDGQPLLGKPEFEHAWDGARYRFVSANHMTLFRNDPDHFAPQFAGSCTMAMSRGMKVEANPKNWLISNGRLFVFYSSDAEARFQADPQGRAAEADQNWELLKSAPFGSSLTR